MTRARVRRRSPVVEAVQWHKPGDHPAIRQATVLGTAFLHGSGQPQFTEAGDWIVSDGETAHGEKRYRVLTPEQFAEEYERVEP